MNRIEMSKKAQFLVTLITFVILGACFKVMVLIDGFTEVRPVNAVPVPAGLLFGTTGSMACAVGNLISDCFGTLGASSILGFLGNFISAYLPYRLWYLYTENEPDVHSFRKLGLYIWVTFVAAVAASWMIATGVWLIFQEWIRGFSLIIFMNDMVFPVLFGLPVFIVLTSDSVGVRSVGAPKSLLPVAVKYRRKMVPVYTLLLVILTVMTGIGNAELILPARVLSVPAIVLTLLLVL